MKCSRLIIGLFLLQVLLISCTTNLTTPTITDYTWVSYTSDLDGYVTCTYFINEKTGYVAGSASIYKTVDGGIHWKVINTNELSINSIYFVNDNLGYAVGGGGTVNNNAGSIIYKTTDAGVTWVKIPLAITKGSDLQSVFFINENIGFAVGLGLYIKTTDGGQTWTNFEFEPNFQGIMRKISFVDAQTGFAAGTDGSIYKTSDQGKKWTKVQNGTGGQVYDFCFVNSTGYAARMGKIIKSIDNGDTWSELSASPTVVAAIHFMDENIGIAIGNGHNTTYGWTKALFYTKDGGVTWKMDDTFDFSSIVNFPASTIGFSIGTKSTVKIQLK